MLQARQSGVTNKGEAMIRLLIVLFALTAAQVQAASAPVKIDEGDTITSKTDVSVTSSAAVLLSAANTSRAALNCRSSQEIRWGDSGISATKGDLIAANTNFVIRNTGAVYARAVSSTATVSCTEETVSTASGGGPIFSP